MIPSTGPKPAIAGDRFAARFDAGLAIPGQSLRCYARLRDCLGDSR
jgi:hypothetical protein